MTRVQSALLIQTLDADDARSIRRDTGRPILRAIARARPVETLDDDARFAEIEDIYLSGMLSGIAATAGTRH